MRQARQRSGVALRKRGLSMFGQRVILLGSVLPTGLLLGLNLQASLVPETARGSATDTFVRATAAKEWGFASDANAGASPILLPISSGEARFAGARRISEGVWSPLLADGAIINLENTANASLYVDALGPFGYRTEGQRINLAVRSRAWQNASWVKTNITANDDEVPGIDGLTRAASLTATVANGTIIQDLGVIGSAAKAWAPWIKRKTGAGDIELTLNGGGSWTTITVTSEFTQVPITATLADPDIGIRIVALNDAIYVDYGQCEAGTFLSSPIPETGASAVTRNSDVLTYDDVGNILDVAGTAFAEASTEWASTPASAGIIARTNVGMLFAAGANPATEIRSQDGTNTSIATGTSMFNAPQKLAATWGSALTAYYNGSPDVTPAPYDGTIDTGNLRIGSIAAGGQLFGTIRNVKIFNREYSHTEVLQL